jgi:homoserine kinase
MQDRIHQPYRAEICPLLPKLLPLAGKSGILGVALSGAGPAMLVVVGSEKEIESASGVILTALKGGVEPRLVVCRFENVGAQGS